MATYKTLMLDVETVQGGSLAGATVYISYDRTVRLSGGGIIPDPASNGVAVPVTGTASVQVLASDDPDLAVDASGFGITVRVVWTEAPSWQRKSKTYVAQVHAADAATVNLSDHLATVATSGVTVLQGPVGPVGPAGPTGPAGTVTDSSVAAVIGDTQTKAALDAAYAPTVDDATTASGKAVDLGHLPTYLLTTESRQVADIEYLFVRAQDSLTPGAVGGTTIGADMSAEFTTILNTAAAANMRVILGPGDYFLSNVTVPDRTWIGSMGSIGTVFPASAKRGPVRLIHADPASGNPMMIFSGHGYVIEDVTCMGLPFAGTGVSWVSPMPASPYPPLFQLTEFFESQLRRVTFTNHPGEALRIDSASNSVFDRVQMKFVGHPSAAALRITGTGLTNSIDFDKLDMEFCPNNYIEVGALGSSTGKNVAEFIRFYAPHLESPDPKTIDASGGVTYYNDQALIRVGLAGDVNITDPFLYGSIGGLISHECPTDATTGMTGANNFLGGVSVKGGILLGRSATANQNSTGTAANNPYAVHLITGNGFHLSGTSLVRYATAASGGAGVSIASGYGPDVTTDPTMAISDTTVLLITSDGRTTYAPTVVTDGGAGTGATATLAAGSDQYAGQITVTTGTSPIAGGFVKFNYPRARSAAKSVFVVAANQKAAQSGYYIGYNLSAGFQISLAVAPAASTAYTFNYRVTP